VRYIVQPGDTLFFIARRFGTTIDAILKANPQITDPDRIFVGQVITVPTTVPPAPPPGATRYVVQPGDTLSAISRRFGITLQALIAANPQIANPDLIFPGQLIFIPRP
jgi:spore coat assembly protein SafA